MAISGERCRARAIIRFATFAHATRITMMPAMMNGSQPLRSPSSRWLMGVTARGVAVGSGAPIEPPNSASTSTRASDR